MTEPGGNERRWYDLFSRGSRDWLRHNAKLGEAVREKLPELIAGPDVITRPADRKVQVPVRFLEHYRFRLADDPDAIGAGQGEVRPGDVLGHPARGRGEGQAGSGGGELNFVFEFDVDDIVEWIWQELELPDLKPRSSGRITDEEIVREGWDRRGPRPRLDRRRTLREAVKRRAASRGAGPDFSDDDLRFHQIAHRRRPATDAVVLLILDVSASMDEARRKLAKSFFFWTVQGLRRQYGRVETVFLAHTNQAWEFTEEEFFRVTATGGTVASSAFRLAAEILDQRFDPASYNAYVFYASDGDNFADDRQRAYDCLMQLGRRVNFMGFVETPQNFLENGRSETGRLFQALAARNQPVATFTAHGHEDVWKAIRAFFTRAAGEAA